MADSAALLQSSRVARHSSLREQSCSGWAAAAGCGIIPAGGSAVGRLGEHCCSTALPAQGADVCRDREGILMPPASESLHRGGSHPPRVVPAVPSQGLFWVWLENQRSLKGPSHICLINLDCYLWIFFAIKTIIQYNPFLLFLSFWVFLNTTSPQIHNPSWFSQPLTALINSIHWSC